ncbi:hypothetical protein [Jannaschia pohangensis]|uniref:Uncharacterized protein n=1 Tax=Jannaschia pohangensis TaxID=390807 RepID=A0A1I3PXY5_9RHOB|nr:hypothetical protein [Jannaschia pohangensis]SFJ26493.1 hypothetical protein SAMN04488095_2346 [Jannaschia pohangensis]
MTRRRPRSAVPTRPRRIHLTDREWAAIGAAAAARAVSRSRYVAEAALDTPVSSTPDAGELIDEMRLAMDGILDLLASVIEGTTPVQTLHICGALDRIDDRLIRALDATSGRGR